MRIHHCIGDGTAAMVVCNELFGTASDVPHRCRRGRAAGTCAATTQLATGLRSDREGGTGWRSTTARTTFDAVTHPTQLVAKAALVLDGASMLAAELLKSPDPRSPLKGRSASRSASPGRSRSHSPTSRRSAGPGREDQRRPRGRHDGRAAHVPARRGVDVDQVGVRAIVPVDLRPPARALELGNQFGLVILELPLQARRSRDRLRLTKQRMDALKRSPEPVAILALFDMFGRGPKAAGDPCGRSLRQQGEPGDDQRRRPAPACTLAGVPIDRLMFWVPHPGRQLGMGISILSYKGEATLAVVADAHLVPDPEAITSAFGREFARMSKAARVPSARHPGRARHPAGKQPRSDRSRDVPGRAGAELSPGRRKPPRATA